ncbi:cytochrome p450 [Botrytis cinerea]
MFSTIYRKSGAISLANSNTVIAGCIVFALYYLFQFLNSKKLNFDAPVIGDASDLRSALINGYNQCPNTPFLLPTAAHPTIILPIKYIDEIKSLPPDKISFLEEFRDRYFGHYTAFANNTEGDAVTTSVKVDLTQSIARALENMQAETELAFATELPKPKDWIPIYALYSPELKKVRQHYTDAAEFLRPIFNQRFKEMERDDFEKPQDMIQWMIDNSGNNAKDATFQGRCQLLISFAALHTTSGLLGNAMLDLAARPKYIEALREEIAANLPENTQITKQILTKLRKMDSFLKESQRMNPLNLVTMNRKMMDTVQLSDGTILPKGSFLGMAAGSIGFDPRIFENPDEFDGFRFEKLRQQEGAENKFQLVTTGKDSLAFGHGTHSCPGRFFASNEIKTMLIELLRNYDFQLLPGTERPKNLKSDMSLVVDPTAQIQIKERCR